MVTKLSFSSIYFSVDVVFFSDELFHFVQVDCVANPTVGECMVAQSDDSVYIYL